MHYLSLLISLQTKIYANPNTIVKKKGNLFHEARLETNQLPFSTINLNRYKQLPQKDKDSKIAIQCPINEKQAIIFSRKTIQFLKIAV